MLDEDEAPGKGLIFLPCLSRGINGDHPAESSTLPRYHYGIIRDQSVNPQGKQFPALFL